MPGGSHTVRRALSEAPTDSPLFTLSMKVRFLTPMATASDSFEQDEIRDLPQVQASQLIASGIAEAVQQVPEQRKLFARRPSNSAAAAS